MHDPDYADHRGEHHRLGTTILALSTLMTLAAGDSAAATLGPAPPIIQATASAPTGSSTRQAEPKPSPSRPDLTVGLPDLRVGLTHFGGHLEPGEEVVFTASVRNRGDGPGKPVRLLLSLHPDFTNVRVIDAPGFSCTVAPPGIVCKGGQVPAGQTVEPQFKANMPQRTGDYAASTIVDPQNAVDEQDEQNNRDDLTFQVRRCASIAC